jgi:protease I
MEAQTTLKGKTIALIATDGFEDSELTEPMETLENAGADVVVISDTMEPIVGKHDAKIAVDKTVEAVDPADYDALLIPGGVENPDKMRMNQRAVQFVKSFFTMHKPVAAICHGPWLLAEADVLHDRTVTSWPSLKTDMHNAGADWVDEPVVVDGNLITSRKPDDIPAFNEKVLALFSGLGSTHAAF